MTNEASGSILLIGASRGLGLAIAEEFLKKGWSVTGTVRGGKQTRLHDLEHKYKAQLEIETLDITDAKQLAALHDRLSGRAFDIYSSTPAPAIQTRHKPSPKSPPKISSTS
jgi:NAD(P)-dependent dehydrogenase (short-subunit alcohol dehydrogenase family)